MLTIFVQLRSGGDVEDTHGTILEATRHHVTGWMVDNTPCTFARREKFVHLVVAIEIPDTDSAVRSSRREFAVVWIHGKCKHDAFM